MSEIKNSEIINEKADDKLEAFRRKIGEIGRQELAKGKAGESARPHFKYLDPKDLIEADREAYEKFKKGSLSQEDVIAYRAPFLEIADHNASRVAFMEWLIEIWFEIKKK